MLTQGALYAHQLDYPLNIRAKNDRKTVEQVSSSRSTPSLRNRRPVGEREGSQTQTNQSDCGCSGDGSPTEQAKALIDTFDSVWPEGAAVPAFAPWLIAIGSRSQVRRSLETMARSAQGAPPPGVGAASPIGAHLELEWGPNQSVEELGNEMEDAVRLLDPEGIVPSLLADAERIAEMVENTINSPDWRWTGIGVTLGPDGKFSFLVDRDPIIDLPKLLAGVAARDPHR